MERKLSQTVLKLRERYPRWGKDKLVVLLRRQGWQVSTSMTGRILTSLKARGVLKEPPATRDIGTESPASAPLCGAQAQGVPGHESR